MLGQRPGDERSNLGWLIQSQLPRSHSLHMPVSRTPDAACSTRVPR